VIERWLQITCDRCGETATSTDSDMTIREFRNELGKFFKRRKGRDLCERCDNHIAENPGVT